MFPKDIGIYAELTIMETVHALLGHEKQHPKQSYTHQPDGLSTGWHWKSLPMLEKQTHVPSLRPSFAL